MLVITFVVRLILPAHFIVNPSRVKWKCAFGEDLSVADAVTPEVANERTFRFTCAYRSIISAVSSHEGPEEGALHSPPPGRKQAPYNGHLKC